MKRQKNRNKNDKEDQSFNDEYDSINDLNSKLNMSYTGYIPQEESK